MSKAHSQMMKKMANHQITTSVNKYTMTIGYGLDCQRWRSMLEVDGRRLRSTVYMGDYEEVTEKGVTRGFYYLGDNVLAVRESGAVKFYNIFTDNLGSILSVMDETGNKVFDATYSAWGRQEVTTNTIGLHRGYCGHEMLDEFQLINMNGRLYDPMIGRFLSPDNYVQLPDNSQSYRYCLNNPLKYNDPGGELFGIDDIAIISFALVDMASSMMNASFNGENIWKAGGLSLLSSAASYGVGLLFGEVGKLGNELCRAGAHGLASGVLGALNGENFISSTVAGMGASLIGSYAQASKLPSSKLMASTTIMGGALAWATRGDFLAGAIRGLSIGGLNFAEGENKQKESSNTINRNLPNVTVTGTVPIHYLYVVRFAAGNISTISNFIVMSNGNKIKGFILEPGGPATTKSGCDKRIPDGAYNMTLTHSNKFGNVYLISNKVVSPGRKILLHAGNTGHDTLGCLMPGKSMTFINGEYQIGGSRKTLSNLMMLFAKKKVKLFIYTNF